MVGLEYFEDQLFIWLFIRLLLFLTNKNGSQEIHRYLLVSTSTS